MKDGIATMKRFVRHEPVLAISVAVAAGFLLGRGVARSVYRRAASSRA
jgi:ElaB/YqjD/DUF883 family membrane-anchored ribosome-binding protein